MEHSSKREEPNSIPAVTDQGIDHSQNHFPAVTELSLPKKIG